MADLTPQTPDWWLSRLITELGARQERYSLLDRYLRSDPPLPPGPEKGVSKAFEYLRKRARVNWADMIVEALIERMSPIGVRTGIEGDSDLDAEAWRIWEANDLDCQATELHRTKSALGDAYVIVGEVDESISAPRISMEDPRQIVGEFDPVNRSELVAALKVFIDDTANLDRAYLYLPGQVFRASRPRGKSAKILQFTARGWQWEVDEAGDPLPEVLSTDKMPVIWFPNRRDLLGRTLGEYEHVLDDLDRIILLVLQRLQVAVLQAFRQRAVKGNLPEKDAEGNIIDYSVLFSNDPAALWSLPEGVEMWESGSVDLTPILESIKADVRELAGRTRTPLYYLYPDAASGSAEGAVTQREGLIFKAGARIKETSGPWERVLARALEVQGMTPQPDMELLWLPPSLATDAERYDAATKAKSADVPWETVMSQVLMFGPQAIARMKAERVAMPAADPVAGLSV